MGDWKLQKFHLAADGSVSIDSAGAYVYQGTSGWRVGARRTGKVRLHALQTMDENPPSLEILGTLLGQNCPLDPTARPELMVHLAPRRIGIGPERRRAVLAHHHRRRLLHELQIDNRARVDAGLDRVGLAVRGERHAHGVGGEVVAVRGELEGLEVVAAEEVRGRGVRVGDFGGKLRRLLDAPGCSQRMSASSALHS